MKDQILHYLSNNIKPAQVATIVGCTPAYISQLLADEDFRAKLTAKLADQPVDAIEQKLDVKYESMEHAILARMEASLMDAELPALTKALHTVALVQDLKHKRKTPTPMQPGNVTNIQLVTLSLPEQVRLAAPVVDMNSQNEILSIDNKPLAPMNSEGVKGLFAKLREKKELSNESRTTTPATIAFAARA